MENLQYRQFADIDLDDPFFDTLKQSYREFPDWFRRKACERAYVFYGDRGLIDGFLYLKEEPAVINDCSPNLTTVYEKGWLKVGTFGEQSLMTAGSSFKYKKPSISPLSP